MALLTREAIQQKRPLEVVEVNVTELGNIINHETGERERTTVFVRELTVREKGAFEQSLLKRKGRGKKETVEYQQQDMRARLVIATCCDADGNLIFCSDDFDHINALPYKVLERICTAARTLNDMLNEHEKEEDEEETVKN